MHARAFAKPCEYVASVYLQWSDAKQPTVIGLVLTTDA